MNNGNRPGELPTKPEFDPWEWLQGDDPANNPGDLLKSCAFQAHRVIEANKGSPEMQKQALDLLNMTVGMFTSFDWKSQDGTISEDAVRRSLVAMYMVGIESTRLAIATKQDSVSIDEVIDELKRQARSASGRKAAVARHSRPGGSRDLKAQIQEVWATGKYKSRDICAEQEWAGLGFGSPKAARNALINTPPPTCAQQVPTTRNGNSTHEK